MDKKGNLPLLFAVKRYALHDGPNIRTTVFFKGCPLRCFWCHNPEGIGGDVQVVTVSGKCIGCRECITGCPQSALSISHGGVQRENSCITCLECVEICPALAHEAVGYFSTVEAVMEEIEKDRIFYDGSNGGVTFSGGEPLMQAAALVQLLKMCGRAALHRAVDTTGYTPAKTILEVAAHTDLFLYDLKMMDNDLHLKYTGVSNRIILENLQLLAESGKPIQLRIPLLAGINDSEQNILQTARFAAGLQSLVGVDLLPFHQLAESKYSKLGNRYLAPGQHKPDHTILQRAANILLDHGLAVQIGGSS